MLQANMVITWKAVIPVLGSVSRHSRLVIHVNNERALQDTMTFVGIQSVCAGVMVLQWMFMNMQVKCLCGALWSSPVDFRPKMLEPQKSISTIYSLGLFSSRYYPMLQTVGLDCYLPLDRGTLNIYLLEVCVYIY
jgi:hypothetical protein